LDIFDVQGRLVRRLLKSELAAGPHEARWDGRDEHGRKAPAGSYYLRLTAKGAGSAVPLTRKIILL
jgi:flagellar hook assembly protein FlgD